LSHQLGRQYMVSILVGLRCFCWAGKSLWLGTNCLRGGDGRSQRNSLVRWTTGKLLWSIFIYIFNLFESANNILMRKEIPNYCDGFERKHLIINVHIYMYNNKIMGLYIYMWNLLYPPYKKINLIWNYIKIISKKRKVRLLKQISREKLYISFFYNLNFKKKQKQKSIVFFKKNK